MFEIKVHSNKTALDTISNLNQDTIDNFIFEIREVIIGVARRFGFCKRKTIGLKPGALIKFI